jgi:putative membrane protein
MALLDDSERKRIETAIGELEQQTAAEVVVAVVGRSSEHVAARALVGFALALVAGLGFLELLPLLDARLALFVELVVGFATFALCGWRPLERLLVAPAAARREVEEHAFALFARRGLYRTRSHTGVLLLISELERHAVILGDEAIHGRLGPEGWQAHIDRVVGAIRSGEPARGILETLAALGPELAELAPAEARNDDELPNAVIVEP